MLTVTNPNAVYGGTVHLTSSDPQAVLPADYTFLPGDKGTHTFGVQLRTTGIQSVTATDTANATNTATASTTLGAAAAARLVLVSGSGQTAGILTAYGAGLTVEAFDAFGNPALGTSVTFTTPATGASATFSGSTTVTVATGLSGTATSSQLTANAFTGTFAVQATAVGVAAPVSFSLTQVSSSSTPPAFTISSNPTTLTVAPGGSSAIAIGVQSSGGLSTPIQLTCTTPTPSLTCQVSPSPVLPSASGASVPATLTVQSSATIARLRSHTGVFFAAFLPLCLLGLTRRCALRGVLLTIFLAILLGGVSGCGSGDAGTHPGSYSVVVTGTSGALTNSVTVLVYVTGYPAGN